MVKISHLFGITRFSFVIVGGQIFRVAHKSLVSLYRGSNVYICNENGLRMNINVMLRMESNGLILGHIVPCLDARGQYWTRTAQLFAKSKVYMRDVYTMTDPITNIHILSVFNLFIYFDL